jgi:predicted small secreted protein
MLLALFGFAVAACNTVEGVGRDVESAGQGLQDEADDADDDNYNSRY